MEELAEEEIGAHADRTAAMTWTNLPAPARHPHCPLQVDTEKKITALSSY